MPKKKLCIDQFSCQKAYIKSATIVFSLLIEYLIGIKKVYVLMRRFIIQIQIKIYGWLGVKLGGSCNFRKK